MTRAVLLVPFRGDGAQRDRLWAWCEARWRALMPELEIVVGEDPLPAPAPFSRAAALNDAARKAGDWDFGVVIDADVFIDPDAVRAGLARAAEIGKVVWPFQRWNGLTRAATDLLLASGGSSTAADLRVVDQGAIERTNPISWSCCIVVPRAVWDDVGGFDERFRGWGWEDMAFQSVVCGLYGHDRLDGDLFALWHPRADERIKTGRPEHPAYIANRMLGRRYMYALRVLGLHDRPVPSDEEEMERDRQNVRRLARNEELDHRGNPKVATPDWREWWPSLEELRDSAKAGLPPGPADLERVAIVMRSGGTLAAWPDRREYLRRSLASIDRHVDHHPIAARVLFSDWPAAIAEEVRSIAEAHGFYVVGGGHNRGFTAAMRGVWTYLATREWSYDYAFLTEDDFELERDVDLRPMMAALRADPGLVQMALLRDACYPAEREAGGILGHPVDEFVVAGADASPWLEHRRFFTLNPSLVRRSLFARPWPIAPHSEAVFGRQLFAADPRTRAGLWGVGDPWIRHLGEVRAGAGY